MICPHCNYESGWNSTLMEIVKGVKGDFYTLPIEVTRSTPFYKPEDRKDVHACPSCGKMFIEVTHGEYC